MDTTQNGEVTGAAEAAALAKISPTGNSAENILAGKSAQAPSTGDISSSALAYRQANPDWDKANPISNPNYLNNPQQYKIPDNMPSSSASVVTNGNINNAINPTTNILDAQGNTITIDSSGKIVSSNGGNYTVGQNYSGYTPGGTNTNLNTTDQYGNVVSGPATTNEQYMIDNYGMTLQQIRAQYGGQGGSANLASIVGQEKANTATYTASEATENASWAATQQKINSDMNSAVATAAANAAKAAPDAIGTASSDAKASITALYDTAMTQAQAQHSAAMAALAAGNTKQASDLLSAMNDTLEKARVDSANIANSTATTQANISTKFQTQADTQLKTITSQTASAILALPDSTSQMTPDQLSTLTSTPGYNDLITSGMSQDDALGYIKNAAQSNAAQIAQQKVQNQANELALNTQKLQNQLAEFDLTHAQTATNQAGIAAFSNPAIANGNAYASALNAIQGGGVKDTPDSQGMTNAGNIGTALTNGDLNTANQTLINMALQVAKKNDPSSVKIYTGINTINQYMNQVATLINQLPSGLQPGLINGTIQNIEAWAGQNKTGNNSTIAAEINDAINHATILYATEIASSRPSAELMSSIKSTLPNYADSNALNTASINAMSSLTNSINSSVIGGAIGLDNYQKIFGGSTQNANTTTTGQTVNYKDPKTGTSYPVGSTWTVGGKTVVITATGPQYQQPNVSTMLGGLTYTSPF